MRRLFASIVLVTGLAATLSSYCASAERRLLYVATPGIRNYLEYGGHGLLVFDIDRGHRFVKRIPTGGVNSEGKPINVKGICASAISKRIYISTISSLMCIDMVSEKLLWEHNYDKGCDRMALSPDGKVIYQPTFEKDQWYVLDAMTGKEITRITPDSRAHNTVYGADGRRCYLAGLGSPLLTVADTKTHSVHHTVGPFSNRIRPFTVNGKQTLAFVCINDCLGFEIGDIPIREETASSRSAGLQQGQSEATWLSVARDRFDAGRARNLGLRCTQSADARVRCDSHAAQSNWSASSAATSRGGLPSASTELSHTLRPVMS